jgi:hypothetical protein
VRARIPPLAKFCSRNSPNFKVVRAPLDDELADDELADDELVLATLAGLASGVGTPPSANGAATPNPSPRRVLVPEQ